MKPSAGTLKEVKLLRKMEDHDLDRLIDLGSFIAHEPHTNVVVEGELSWGLFVILQGIVGIFKNNKLSGETYDVGQLREGNFFGEMSLIDESPRSATVRTLTACGLFYISKESFNFWLDSVSGLRLKFYENCIGDLVQRLRELDDNYVVSQYQLWRFALKNQGQDSNGSGEAA